MSCLFTPILTVPSTPTTPSTPPPATGIYSKTKSDVWFHAGYNYFHIVVVLIFLIQQQHRQVPENLNVAQKNKEFR